MAEEIWTGVAEGGFGDVKGFDDLLDHLGTGRWSLLYFVIVAIWGSCVSLQSLGGGFAAPVMNFTCRHPATTTLASSTPSPTISSDFVTSNTTNNFFPIDECRYYVNSSDGAWREERCTEWDFDHSTFGNTLTSEMSLVCERAYLVPLYQSVFMFGAAIGAWLGGILSDQVGRRPVFMWGAMMYVAVGTLGSFLPNVYLVLIARTALGALYLASHQAGYVLVTETSTSRVRPVAGILVLLPWALGVMVNGGLGYSIREWRHLQLATLLPFTALFPIFWLMEESPRWLLVKGELWKAQLVFNKAARWNKVQAPPPGTLQLVMANLHCQSQEKEEKDESVSAWLHQRVLSLLVLFRSKTLFILMLVVCFNFFTASLVYYGLSLSAVNFSTDPFVFMTLSGLSEIPSYTITGFILARLGRKGPAIFCYIVTGMALVALPFIPQEAAWVMVTLALIGKVTITSVFSEMYLYSSEVFPTEVRLQCLGTGMLFSRFGSILSPFMNDMLVPIYPWMTSVVFGGMSVMAGLMTLLLPETRGANMSDVVAELEATPIVAYQAAPTKDNMDDTDKLILHSERKAN